jgi:hypothetical protein
MKNNGGGGGRGVWLFSKWNIEIKEVFLHSHVKAKGPMASCWHRRIRADLTQ